MHAVDKVHVGEAGGTEHDRIALGSTEAGMRSEVLGADVGLDLDDSADPKPEVVLPDEVSADQPSCSGQAVGREVLSQGNIATIFGGSRKPVLWTSTGMAPSRSAEAMCD